MNLPEILAEALIWQVSDFKVRKKFNINKVLLSSYLLKSNLAV